MTTAADALARLTSDSVMPPTPVEMTLTPTLSVDSLVSAFATASTEPCTSALRTILTSLTSPALILSRMFSSDTRPRARQLLLAARVVPVLDQRLGRLLVGDDVEDLARVGHAVEAQHLDRRRRAGLGDRLALVVQHGADLPRVLAGDDQVADAQRAFLDQDGRDGAARAIEPRLDDVALGRLVRVGLQLEHLGLQGQHLEQLVDALLGLGRHVRRRWSSPPHSSGTRSCSDSLVRIMSGLAPGLSILLTATTIGTSAVLGVVDRLDRLRHRRRRRPRRPGRRCRSSGRRGRAWR